MKGQTIKILLFLFSITVAGIVNSYAQQVKTFQKSYGGTALDYSLSMMPMQDKGFLIAGRTASFGNGGTDIIVIRTDSLGKAKWTKTYGGSSDEAFDMFITPMDMIQVPDSNFVICTGTKSYGAGGGDIYLLKIDKDGNVKWTRTIGRSTTEESGTSIIMLPDAGFMITGQTKATGSPGDVIVVRTNDTGGVVWTKTYGSSGDEAGLRIIPSVDGKNYLVGGIANVQQYDFYVLKINGTGGLLWSKVYGDTYYDVAEDIDQLPDGSIYISGNTTNSAFGGGSGATADNDMYIVKADSSGRMVWGKHFGGNAREVIRQLYFNPDKTFDVLAAGSSFGPGNPQSVYYMKLDTAGAVKRMKTYGTSGTQTLGFGNLFSKFKDSSFAICGSTNGFGAGNFDFYFIKTDPVGNTNNCKVETQTPKVMDRDPSTLTHTTTTSTITASTSKGVTVKNIAINSGTGTLKDAFICEPFVAGFEWKNACEDQPTQFYDTTYRSATTWSWNFGDPSSSANTSSLKNPTHVYKDTGTYTVKLVASKTGAKDSISYKVKVYPTPQAVSTTKDTTVCLGEAVQLSTGATVGTFYWSPGEFLSDSLAQQPWAYPTRSINFVLKVTNASGCSATDTVKVTLDTTGKCKKINGISGIINKYSKVTKVDTCEFYLALDSASNFKAGDKALLIQMKGAVIDTSNTSDFGKILDYKSAGKYEYITIESVSGGKAYSKYKFINTYDVNSAVQLVSIPVYKNVYVVGKLTAPAWNGNTGGVLIFEATDTANLNGIIDVSGKGFRGGKASIGSANCHKSDYYYANTSSDGAEKGEGIAATKAKFSRGMGANANGGGGGNANNAGGGGGSNASSGGEGGKENDNCGGTILSVGGKGGYALSYSAGTRVFMGGGGGAGHNNDGTGTDGGNGGGIVIVNANRIVTNYATISGNGLNPKTTSSADAAGGGGGGGSVTFYSPNPVTSRNTNVLLSGGNGGFTSGKNCTGPGGGGSSGVLRNWSIYYFDVSSFKWTINGGTAGVNTNGSSVCYNTSYGASNGQNNNYWLGALNPPESKIGFGNIIKPVTTVCSGDSVTLSATGGVKYIWSPSNLMKDSTKQTVKARLDKQTKFTVKIYNAAGCYRTDTVTVAPIPSPILPAVTLQCVSVVDNNTIKLTWQSNFKASDSLYFGRYTVYRKKIWETGALSVYDTVGSIHTDTYTDTKATRNDTAVYVYQIRPTTLCGRNGSASLEIADIQLKYTRNSHKELKFTWNKPYFTFNSRYTLEMDAGTGYQTINTTNANQYVYANCNTTATFRIAIKDTTKKCTTLSTATKQLKLQDTKKPDAPEVINATVTSADQINITIRKSDSTDVKSYSLYRSENGGTYSLVTTINASVIGSNNYLFGDRNSVAADKYSYCYKLIATDSCGNVSDTSVTHCTVNLDAKSGNLRTFLKWNKYKGYNTVDKQVVQRYNSSANKWDDIASLTGGTATTYTDSVGLGCNKTYAYRLATYEKNGNSQISYSDSVAVKSYDSIAPPKVTLLGASVVSDTSIRLDWERLKVNDINFYRIYYSKNGSAFSLLTTFSAFGPPTEKYEHNGINPLKDTFCYYILANDSCSGLTSVSATHCAMELKAKGGNFSADLIWSPYIGFEVQKYHIQKLDNGGNWRTIDSTSATTYKHIGVGCDKWSYYRIQAKEKGGKKFTTISDSAAALPFDTIPPAEVNILSATVIDKNTIALTFAKNADKDVEKYDIWVSENGGTFTKIATRTKPSGTQVLYTHSNSSINTEDSVYCYRVYAVDSCKSNTSRTSETHCAVRLQGTAGNNRANLAWSKYVGFNGVKAYIVQRKNASGWTNVTSVTDTSFTDTLLTCNVEQTYRIVAEENSGDKQTSNSNTIKVTPFDNIKPNAPVIQYVTVNNGFPYIQWAKSTSNDVRNYEVYRKNTSGTFVSIAKLGDVDTFTDVSADANLASYCYKIMAVDSCAKNQSALSDEHCDVWLQTSVKGCEKAVYLNWNTYKGWNSVNKTEIYRTVNGGTETLLATLSASAVSYKDSLLDFHKLYCYRIKAYELGGNASESWSNQGCKQTFFTDTAHIYTASKIVTSATAGKIVIKWRSENGKRYFSHHRLYYTTSAGGTFSLLADNIPVSKDSFIHESINTRSGAHYYYLVTVDSCGTESDKSLIHKPIDLEVEIGQLIHDLSWTKYKGFEVKGYYVQRLSGGTFNTIDTVAANDTAVRIFPAPCNFNIFYRVAAVDEDGRLAFSDTMGRTAIDTIFANAARLHNLTVTGGNSTDLTFRGSDSLDVYAYTIQRSEDGSWGTAGQVLYSTPGDTHLYADKINTLPKQLCYTIITLDSCLNATMSADTFCAVQLKGQELNLENALAWHGFKGYAIDKYSILKHNGAGWDTLSTTSGDTNYLHTPLSCNVPVTYKIAATEKGGKRLTLSDSITLVPFDTVKPAQPIMYYATVMDEQSIYVEWEKSEPDVKKYELSVGTLNTPFMIYDTLENVLNHTFTGLQTMDSTYSFRIRAIDSCSENTSVYSEIHSTIQLVGTPQNLANALNWSAYKGFDVSKYYIYIYTNGWKLFDSTDKTVQSYMHQPLACNVPQWYKIQAKDTEGKFTTWSDSIMLIPFDTLPPAKPIVHFATVEADRTIRLNWSWDTSSDVKYFEVWRSTNGGAYSNIATVVYDSVYNDVNVTPQSTNYAYYVIAIDSCNTTNRSQAADAHKIINLKLATGACLPEIRLNWTKYADLERGVDGYDIFRMANNESSYTKIATVSEMQTDYTDASVSLGVTYFYKIRAFDNETVYESYSDTSGLEPYQFPVPQPSKLVYASVRSTGTTQGSIYIEWEKYLVPGDTFARGYNLYHRVNNGAFSLLHKSNDLDETSYIHSGINTSNDLHEYFVRVFNLCDIEGDSNTILRPANLEVENRNLEAVITWHPFNGESITKYELYKARNNATARLLATFTSADTTYTDLDLYCDNDYTYSLRAYLANGRVSHADTVKIKAFDTIPPVKPDLYFVSVDSTHATVGKISMMWKGNNEPNRAGYRIYRSVNGGPMNLHIIYLNTTTGDIFWEDKNLNTIDNYYSYAIAAIDSCTGNQSMPSDTHQTVLLKTTAVSEYMQLNWQLYKGFKNYKFTVEKKEPNKPWRILDTVDATITSYRDSDVVCHVFYNYRIRSVDDTSIWVSLSNQSGDTAFEHVLPAAPLINFATVTNTGITDGKVLVTWQPSTSKDAMYYNLYRSEDGFNWQVVVNAHTALFYEDLAMNTAEKSYFYRLTTTDTCGNVSDIYSVPHKTILLNATAGNSENILNWSAYQGYNVKEYRIYRDGQKYFSVPGTQTTVTDTGVICTQKYGYYVVAVADHDTTLYASSNIDSAQPYDTKAPRALYLRTATVSMPNKEVTLEWDASSNFDTRIYYIYKRSGVDGKINLIDSTTALTYTEIQDSISVSDCYFVHAVDHCNNISEKSNRACLMILDGRSFDGLHVLSWNSYEVWKDGVKNYRIYKKQDDQNWREIGYSNQTSYVDEFIDDTVSRHCYQIEAIENEGTHNAVSLSTAICLYQDPVVFVPNAFSPGMSEGDNDVFGPKGINMRNYKMQIFNRWGQLVYETVDGKPWDGTYGGELSPLGVYMYIITVDSYNSNGDKRVKGTVTILR